MTTAAAPRAAFRSHIAGMPKQFWVLWWGQLGNRIGGVIRPFLAIYLTGVRHRSVAEVGLLLGCIGLGGLAAQPVGGHLSDRLGRRRVLIGALLASAAAALCLGQARSTWALALFCVVNGFCADLYRPPSSAAVADIVKPADRVRAYGLLFWAANAGFAAAAVIGGIAANISYSSIFVIDAATTLAFAAVIWLRFPETQHAEQREQARASSGFREVLRDRVMLAVVGCVIASATVYMQVDSTMAVVMRRHGIEPALYGAIIALNGIIIVVCQPWAVTVTARVARVPVLSASAVVMAIGFALTRVCGGSVLAYALTLVIWTLGEVMQAGLFATIVGDLAPPHLRGRYMGIFGFSFGASAMLAPVIGTQVLAHGGETGLWLGAGNLMLISGIGFALLEPKLRARGAAGPESPQWRAQRGV